jgi:hypothetical protein
MSQKSATSNNNSLVKMKRAYSDNSKIVEKTKSVLETMKQKTPISINSSLPKVTKNSFTTSRFARSVSSYSKKRRKPKKPSTKKSNSSPRAGKNIKKTKKGGRKRTRRRRKKKRSCKKRIIKKTICLKGINKKAMRKLVKVTKKLGKMKGIKMTRCSKRRIKKWT